MQRVICPEAFDNVIAQPSEVESRFNKTAGLEDFDRVVAWLGEVVKDFGELMSYLSLR